MTSENIKNFIFQWNSTFPLDYRWRKKHNISFGSDKHLLMNQIDIYIDIQEDNLIKKYFKDKDKKEKDLQIYRDTGNWLKKRNEDIKTSKKEIDKWFDDFDVSKLNK